MHADNAVFNQGGDRKEFEAVRKGLPETKTISAFALVVKAIDLVDIVCFVISTKKEKVVRILHLVGQQKTNTLDSLLAAVDIITTTQNGQKGLPQKQVIRLGRISSIFKQTEQVVVLSVNIT